MKRGGNFALSREEANKEDDEEAEHSELSLGEADKEGVGEEIDKEGAGEGAGEEGNKDQYAREQAPFQPEMI